MQSKYSYYRDVVEYEVHTKCNQFMLTIWADKDLNLNLASINKTLTLLHFGTLARCVMQEPQINSEATKAHSSKFF